MKRLYFLIFLSFLASAAHSQSVLSKGDWWRVGIKDEGIYKLSWKNLRELGFQNINDIRIYGHGGKALEEICSNDFATDLLEIPLKIYKSDKNPDQDFILFYAKSCGEWQWRKGSYIFDYVVHFWDNFSYYFITEQPGGKKILSKSEPLKAAPHVDFFDFRDIHLREEMNLPKSGRFWVGEDFRTKKKHQISFDNRSTFDGFIAEINFWNASPYLGELEITCNNQQIAKAQMNPNSSYNYASETIFTSQKFNPNPSNNQTIPQQLNFEISANDQTFGWLKYISLFGKQPLELGNVPLFFRHIDSHLSNSGAIFNLKNTTDATEIWDITDQHSVFSISHNRGQFYATTDILREFVAFNPETATAPSMNFERVENQSINDNPKIDMIIVTHKLFFSQAQQLAHLHQKNDNLKVKIVSTEQIYNQYSSGMQDVSAIRNYAKHIWEQGKQLKYLLLFGAGSFDNKNLSAAQNASHPQKNFVVTYQSENSSHQTNSFVSDDFFGILENNSSIMSGEMNIAVGRLPVKSTEEAQGLVQKIKNYMEFQPVDPRNSDICFVSDDGDSFLHLLQAEQITSKVENLLPQLQIHKLYCDRYQQKVTIDGHRYPELNRDLLQNLERGLFFVNYIGHGNYTGWAEERLLTNDQISKLKNTILPLFLVATCEFARYDDPTRTTAGENLIINYQGGAIAVVASPRLVYSNLNFLFNQAITFELLQNQNPQARLGDFFMNAKNSLAPSVNTRCFALLADPAISLHLPRRKISDIQINSTELAANGIYSISGKISDFSDLHDTRFNGIITAKIFADKQQNFTVQNDNSADVVEFFTQNSLLGISKFTVQDGIFNGEIQLPQDIYLNGQNAKLSLYALSDNGIIANGALENIQINGINPSMPNDYIPEISIYLNHQHFQNDDFSNENPTLFAKIYAENGINLADFGLGHNIQLHLSGPMNQTYSLNDYFSPELNNLKQGTIAFQLKNLPEGQYLLTVVAYDSQNHRGEKSITFNVGKKYEIYKFFNYPNPASTTAKIHAEFSLPEEQITSKISLISSNGNLILSQKSSFLGQSNQFLEINLPLESTDKQRLPEGVYILRLDIQSNSSKLTKTTKLVIKH